MKALEFQSDSQKQTDKSLKPSFGTSPVSKLGSWLANLSTALTTFIHTPNEPKIAKITNGHGHSWWVVKDPRTQRTYQFATEGEVRIWLERQYYPG